MKKVLPVIVVLLIVVGLWFAISSRIETQPGTEPGASTSANQENPDAAVSPAAGSPSSLVSDDEGEEDGEIIPDTEEKPAVERYKNAEEALNAIKAAAADYDDLVLDQFTEPGPNCSWCDSFYSSVRELMLSPDTKADQRGYYAEVLAISGRVENVKTLVDAINNAKTQEEGDAYAEALELTVGKDAVVKYLGEQLNQGNEVLREASVAAITNQGSRQAVETLYSHTVEKGDLDGYYSLGIGLGEVVPDEEALPYLQELAMKRDPYSHLAIKALLNAGLDGVKMVMDVLSNSKSPDLDKEMLKSAKDHVSYDEDVVNYLRQQSGSGKSSVAVDFSNEILAEFDQAQKESEQEAQQEGEGAAPAQAPMSMIQPPEQ